jgi:hypothetical protein
MSAMRICSKCETSKPEDDFYNSGKYKKTSCKSCDNKGRKRRSQHVPTAAQKQSWTTKNKAKQRKERRACINTAKYIYWDLRKDDRKAGRDNDLTKEFIQAEIDKGCAYCGEAELRMTLDRIDNERGHTTDNVVPACIRCNYLRGSMPHQAWLRLTGAIREVREEGLFGDWTGRARIAHQGDVAERLMAPVSKTGVGNTTGGSNPSVSAMQV